MKRDRTEKLWTGFAEQFGLSEKQLATFQTFQQMLLEYNEKFNLTAITSLSGIIGSHFSDSLALRQAVDLKADHIIVDVGSGAGFPGIPIKIVYPHLKMILIEVTGKRRKFLQAVIDELGLEGIEICDLDFCTFVRTTEAQGVDLVLARASLDPVELCRMVSPISPYNSATLVYCAAQEYEVPAKIEKYFDCELAYEIKRKKRKLVLFAKS